MHSVNVDIFNKYESEVRSYCRNIPVVFNKAKGSVMYDEENMAYIDFLSGAGALNYGHNHDQIRNNLIHYLREDNIILGLDLHSTAKKDFIDAFQNSILLPRNLDYKIQFTSPTGTSVVESAIKLARKVAKRRNVIAFTNAFHGMSGVSLSLTANAKYRKNSLGGDVTRFPFDGYISKEFDSINFYRKLLKDKSSGVDFPAAIIVECVQGEGGVNIATPKWLRDIRNLTYELGILLIVDEIQTGCGRTGRFFSFEHAEIKPDIVCVSKSISGIGLPMAILLLDPALDIWQAGEDNGTFRGNNLAFVAATATINAFWNGPEFENETVEKQKIICTYLSGLKIKYPALIKDTRGLGLMQAIEFFNPEVANKVAQSCVELRLVIETCGALGQVLKIMPALTIDNTLLIKGLEIIDNVISEYDTLV